MLLTQPKPARADGFLKLEIAGQTFYLSVKEAVSADNKAAFTELLEALPPSAKLYKGSMSQTWTEITPTQAAQENRLSFTSRTFSDTKDSPFAREIDTLAAYFMLGGDENGAFHPQDTITRAEFAAMVAVALDLPAGKSAKFSDVSPDAWYADAVSAMADLGFLSGNGNGTFSPDSTMTYQEMVTSLSKVAAWTSMDGYDLDQEDLSMEEFVDFYDFADWARVPARNLAVLEALIEDISPAGPVTREAAAATLCRLMESIHLIWD